MKRIFRKPGVWPLASKSWNSSKMTASFAWPADSLYRPMIGVFLNGVLQNIQPSFRVAPVSSADPSTPWPCQVIVDRSTFPNRSRLVLQCMETAEVIGADPPHAPDATAAFVKMGALLVQEGGLLPSEMRTGFTAFLAMPFPDQLSLIYHTLLGRDVDALGRIAWTKAYSEKITILDIRDAILRSEEFRNQSLQNASPPFGYWPIWSGLADARPGLSPFWSKRHATIQVAMTEALPEPARGMGQRAARLALGSDSSDKTTTRWIVEHSALIASLERTAAADVSNLYRPSLGGTLRLGSVLDSLRIGPAGKRTKTGLRIVQNAESTIFYGPYTSLAGGHYELQLLLDFETLPGAEPACLVLEVVYQDLLLAIKCLRPGTLIDGKTKLGFVVPNHDLSLHEALFEYRLRSHGALTGEIRQIALERQSRQAEAEQIHKEKLDIFPLINPGKAGRHVGKGIFGAAESSGLVFSGLSRALLPGQYRLVITLSEMPKGRLLRAGVLITVENNRKRVLARRWITASGSAELTLSFVVPAPRSVEGRALIEVRLHKLLGSSLTIAGVHIESQRDRAPNRRSKA